MDVGRSGRERHLVVTGATGEFGYHFEFPWYWFGTLLLLQLLTVGLVEEFAFRGYVQSKCIALLGGRSRRRDVALGVVIGAATFAVLHVPTRLIFGQVPPSALPIALLNLTLTGTLFGVMCYLTRNVWYVGFVHGFANVWPVPFDPNAVPAFPVFVITSALLLSVGCWYRTRDAERVAAGFGTARSESG